MKTKLTCSDCCFFGDQRCWAYPVSVTRYRWSPACTLRVNDEAYSGEEVYCDEETEPVADPCPTCGAWMANVLDGLEPVRLCSAGCPREISPPCLTPPGDEIQ